MIALFLAYLGVGVCYAYGLYRLSVKHNVYSYLGHLDVVTFILGILLFIGVFWWYYLIFDKQMNKFCFEGWGYDD